MINKKEFDLLLQEISQIENKIIELKLLNYFEKAKEYEESLEVIRIKAKSIVLDNQDNSNGFDEMSLEVLNQLILLNSDINYYILKINNVIEGANENKIDAEVLQKIKSLWENLEEYIKTWSNSNHNPIEEIEYNKRIAKTTLEIIILQLQAEAIIDFSKIFKYCKKEFLINEIKEILVEGAKNELQDEIRKRRLINLTKNVSEKDLYDYKLWQQILIVKNVRSRDDHIEIIGNLQEKDKRKYFLDEDSAKKENISVEEQDLEVFYDESIFVTIKRWFANFSESINQKKMIITWSTSNGPAFKLEFENEEVKYSREYLDKDTIENVKKLTIATNGVSKYNFEKISAWKNLEELEFLENKNTSNINLSPDKTYNCIGTDCFADSKKLKKISFGKIEIIGERAFKNCTSLSEITFSKNIINIAEDAFLGCTNLTKAVFLGNLNLYLLERPQNIINCFKETKLEEIVFSNLDSVFNFAITDCPSLKKISVENIPKISIPFKTCRYRLGRQEGIVSFIGEKSLALWRKRNTNIRFFELTEEDMKKYNIK